jgi:flagellar basal body P-ring formation chaperone FlgA
VIAVPISRRTLLMIGLIASFAQAQGAGGALTLITKEEVSRTLAVELRARGVPGDELPHSDDIELPAAVPAAEGRSLRIVASCWDATPSRAQFRMECKQSGDCLPFLIYVRSREPGFSAHTVGQACQAGTTVTHSAGQRKPVVRTGDRVAVVYRSSRMRLSTVVTCLDRGAEGDVIRVRNQDGHIFRARISSATLLEALPQ